MKRKHSLNMLLHMFPPSVVWHIILPNGQSLAITRSLPSSLVGQLVDLTDRYRKGIMLNYPYHNSLYYRQVDSAQLSIKSKNIIKTRSTNHTMYQFKTIISQPTIHYALHKLTCTLKYEYYEDVPYYVSLILKMLSVCLC